MKIEQSKAAKLLHGIPCRSGYRRDCMRGSACNLRHIDDEQEEKKNYNTRSETAKQQQDIGSYITENLTPHTKKPKMQPNAQRKDESNDTNMQPCQNNQLPKNQHLSYLY